MKNLKNTLAAIGLVVVLGVGTVTANAGISRSDSSTKRTRVQCSVNTEGVLRQFTGFIVAGLNGMGINTGLLDGLLLSDAPCKTDEEIRMDGFRCR